VLEDSANTDVHLLKKIRDNTQAIEELSLKIDEQYSILSQIDSLTSKIYRYTPEVYETLIGDAKEGRTDIQKLKAFIISKQKEMEAFPRQNSNCVEYYDRYLAKFRELDSKFQA